MSRGEMKGIVWLDDFAFIPKTIGKTIYDADAITSGHSTKIIAMPTANTETKFMSKFLNLQLLDHNNKNRIRKLVRCCKYGRK